MFNSSHLLVLGIFTYVISTGGSKVISVVLHSHNFKEGLRFNLSFLKMIIETTIRKIINNTNKYLDPFFI